MFVTIAALSLLLFGAANAKNDWRTPCTDGTCSWDFANPTNRDKSTATGTLEISGAVSSISDITEAAGWEILDCDPDASQMNIRIVCTGGPTSSCDHVYQGGAPGTVVRMPNKCGQMPFARVVDEWDSDDQSIPNSVLVRRAEDGSLPIVKAMSLDTKFSDIDAENNGHVNFNLAASTDHGATGRTIQPSNRRSRFAHRRSFNRRSSFSDFLNSFVSFNENKTQNLPHIEFSKILNVLKENVQCSPDEASVNIDVGAEVDAHISLNVFASGSIVPPKFDVFGIITGINASLSGSLDIVANALGTFESPAIPFFEVGIPGLDLPGILTIGPSFEVTALARVALNASIDLRADLSFTTEGTMIAFPPSADTPVQGIKPGISNLNISATPSVKATGNAEVHIIPQVSLGITALGVAGAKVFFNVDGSANVQLSLETPKTTTGYVDPDPERVSVPQNSTFNGCVEVGTGISVNVGADSSVFGLFEDSVTKELFAQNFTLFQECFGGFAKRDLNFVSLASRASSIEEANFTCPETIDSPVSPIFSGALTAVAKDAKIQ